MGPVVAGPFVICHPRLAGSGGEQLKRGVKLSGIDAYRAANAVTLDLPAGDHSADGSLVDS